MSGRGDKVAQPGKQKRKSRPAAADHDKVEYQDIRDDFLRRLPTVRDEAEWLVQVGAFVQHCWLAEENARQHSENPEELDELKLWHLWDGCSAKQIEDMQVGALAKLEAHRRRKTGTEISAYLKRKFRPVEWLLQAVGWFSLQAWKGFVSGIGLVGLGLLLAWLAPEALKRVRGTIDTVLPQATRPASLDVDAAAGPPG